MEDYEDSLNCKETVNSSNGDFFSENVKLEVVEEINGLIKTEVDSEETSKWWRSSKEICEEGMVDGKDPLRNTNETENMQQSGSNQTENKCEEFSTGSKQNEEVISSLMSKDYAEIKQTHNVEKKNFTCPVCYETFSKRHIIKQHLKTHSLKNNIKCGLCGKSYLSMKQLKQHSRLHRDADRFSCEVCDRKFSNIGNFKIHLARHTKERNFQCHMCDKSYVCKQELTNHLKRHLDIKDFKCGDCGKEFFSSTLLKHHSTMHTKKLQYHCDICDKTYYRLSSLQQHQMTHKNPQFRCDICEKTFYRRSGLKRHQSKHKNPLFQCQFCKKSFIRRSLLMKHTATHTGVDKGFYHRPLLKAHELNHPEANDKFPCEFCQKPFSTKQRLQIHLHKHIGNNNVCKVCSFESASKTESLEHLRTHIKEKPFQCKFCERLFVSIDIRKKHEAIHSGTKKCHSCPYCGEDFPAKESLIIHKRIHTGDFPFSCDICSESFRQIFLLRRHMKKHHNLQDLT